MYLAAKRVSETDLLRKLVKPGDSVVCIGAYSSPHNDPSPLWLAHEAKARVAIVDAQLRNFGHAEQIKRAMKAKQVLVKRGLPTAKVEAYIESLTHAFNSSSIGTGGLIEYAQATRRLHRDGFIDRVNFRLVPALAWKTGLKPGSKKLVLNRGTWRFIQDQGEQRLKQTIRHCWKLLSPGGSMVFLAWDDGVKGLETTLKKIVEPRARIKKVKVATSQLKPYVIRGMQYPGTYSYRNAVIATKPRKTAA